MEKQILIDCFNFDELDKLGMNQDKIDNLMEKSILSVMEIENIDFDSMELSLTFTTLEEIQKINYDHRGKDEPTDVLSFPQYVGPEEIEEIALAGMEIFLGDVVICLDRVKSQSEEFGHSVERELLYLFTHSILHLLEYDHMNDEDKRLMRGKEEMVMESLGISK